MRIKTAALIVIVGLSADIVLSIASRLIVKAAIAAGDFESYRILLEIMNWSSLVTQQGCLLLLAVTLYRNARS